MTEERSPGPGWDQLLGIGIAYVRTQQPAWIFIGVMVVIQVLVTLVGVTPSTLIIASLVALIAGVYLSLMLSRHALTGAWGFAQSDHAGALRIIGLVLLFAVIFNVIGLLLFRGLFALAGEAGLQIAAAILIMGMLWAIARFGFYIPALSLAHPTTLPDVFRHSAPYWGRLMAVMIGPGVITLLINYLLTLMIRGPAGLLMAAAIGGFVAAVGQAITIAAVAYLYANFVQSTRAA